MGYIKKEKEGEFDFDKLPEGIYFFSGQEGFVKIEVNKEISLTPKKQSLSQKN